nr:GNAT family N-acetyltransferase [uncultured Agathobaculum sp.]
MKIKYVDVTDPDLCALIRAGRSAAGKKYMPQHAPDSMACAVVAYIAGKPVGCGCWRAYDPVSAEIEQMYVCPACRRQGAADGMLPALEQHAAASGCHRAVLAAGADMPEAIALFQKHGYRLMPNYGDFAGDNLCVCMEKEISDGTMR